MILCFYILLVAAVLEPKPVAPVSFCLGYAISGSCRWRGSTFGRSAHWHTLPQI